jgi:predicted nucleic acid-binding protein
VDIVVSPPILSEYRQVGEILSAKYPGVDVEPIAALLALYANVVDAPDRLPEQVCRDVDDDKFLACALAVRSVASSQVMPTIPCRALQELQPARWRSALRLSMAPVVK